MVGGSLRRVLDDSPATYSQEFHLFVVDADEASAGQVENTTLKRFKKHKMRQIEIIVVLKLFK